MRNVLVLGAGKIGAALVTLLSEHDDFAVRIADARPDALDAAAFGALPRTVLDVTDPAALGKLMSQSDAVVSALPYYLNVCVAEVAKASATHYFDLTEDVETTRRIRELAQDAKTAFVPQCGLAPGFVGIAAHSLAQRFDPAETVQMRVGALPQYPSNALMYNLTWSTDGLINEYCNPCEAIYDGVRVEARALDGYERFSLDGVTYEAFNTSGGLGTLCETLAGRVRTLDYKTVRYPGHRDLVKFLTRDLRLGDRRELFREVLEQAVPGTDQDVVLVFVTVSGQRDEQLKQETLARKIYPQTVGGEALSAIQVTTAAGACAMLDMMFDGVLPQAGFVAQEMASLERFEANRFGLYYDDDAAPRTGHGGRRRLTQPISAVPRSPRDVNLRPDPRQGGARGNRGDESHSDGTRTAQYLQRSAACARASGARHQAQPSGSDRADLRRTPHGGTRRDARSRSSWAQARRS